MSTLLWQHHYRTHSVEREQASSADDVHDIVVSYDIGSVSYSHPSYPLALCALPGVPGAYAAVRLRKADRAVRITCDSCRLRIEDFLAKNTRVTFV